MKSCTNYMWRLRLASQVGGAEIVGGYWFADRAWVGTYTPLIQCDPLPLRAESALYTGVGVGNGLGRGQASTFVS